ncbi:MAG TPA: 23S rRNA (guanosine(2251)-2'-O)-methyltransferase RlmB [Clostridia bacterium]
MQFERDRKRGTGRPVRNRREETHVEEHVEAHGDEQERLEGRNPVIEALKSGRAINKVLIAKGEKEGSIIKIAAIAKEKGVVVQEVDRKALDAMSSTRAHQGVIAIVAAKDYVDVDDILKLADEKGEPPFIIILDGITDSMNLGSIMRTANASGAHGIIIPKRRSAGLDSVVAKASAGAVEYVPVSRVSNITQTIEYLKKKNIWIAGTDQRGDNPFFESNLSGPLALVIGSEGEGMGRLVRESCDFIVGIPMMGSISSLNASVAAGIVMYEVLRQRSSGKKGNT